MTRIIFETLHYPFSMTGEKFYHGRECIRFKGWDAGLYLIECGFIIYPFVVDEAEEEEEPDYSRRKRFAVQFVLYP